MINAGQITSPRLPSKCCGRIISSASFTRATYNRTSTSFHPSAIKEDSLSWEHFPVISQSRTQYRGRSSASLKRDFYWQGSNSRKYNNSVTQRTMSSHISQWHCAERLDACDYTDKHRRAEVAQHTCRICMQTGALLSACWEYAAITCASKSARAWVGV